MQSPHVHAPNYPSRVVCAARVSGVVCAVWLIVIMAGCDSNELLTSNLEGWGEGSGNVPTVNVIRLQKVENVYETSVFYGKLKASRQSRLGFARGGRVKSVLAEIGDRVGDGAKLAELEQEQIENQQQEITEDIETARQNLQIAGFQEAPALEGRIQALEKQLEQIELELEKGLVKAPFSCIVSARHIDPGSLVAQGQTALEVVEVVWVLIGNRAVEGLVQARSPLTDSSGSRIVLLQLTSDLQNINWSIGETVEIRFRIATSKSGFWVPFTALQREANGLWSVLVVESGAEPVVNRTILELLQLEDDRALVRGMLNDGDLMIADGTHRVVPGQRVEPVDITGQLE